MALRSFFLATKSSNFAKNSFEDLSKQDTTNNPTKFGLTLKVNYSNSEPIDDSIETQAKTETKPISNISKPNKKFISDQTKFVPKLLPKKSNIIPSPLILSSSNSKISKKFFTRNQKIPFISLEEKAKTSFNEEDDYFNLSVISNSSSNDFNEDENVFKKIKNSIGSNDDTSCDSEQNKKIIMDGLQINIDNDNNNNKITILSILEKMNKKK